MRWVRRLAIVVGIVVLGIMLTGASVAGSRFVRHSQRCSELSAQVQAALQSPQSVRTYRATLAAAHDAYNRECS